MKKTKIIASIGPSSLKWDVFKEMVNSGMNVARINFSHSDFNGCKEIVDLVLKARKELNANIGILYDTKGPDLRTCEFRNDKIDLVEGRSIRIVKNRCLGTDKRISLNYPNVINKLEVGQFVLLDDGFYKLKVTSKDKDGVNCKILNSGTIKSRRGVCIPGVDLEIPFLSKEDVDDIKFACKNECDYLALSFVSCKEDVLDVREILERNKRPDIKIISKIESKNGIDNLDDIIEVSDYIMIARGDLSTEVGYDKLPLYQDRIIDKCHRNSCGVIMATQMMYSMKRNIRPTNAEVNDVANAIKSGCDAIMTSEETTVGMYPVETIKNMSLICNSVEPITKYNLNDYKLFGSKVHNTMVELAVTGTTNLNIKAIVCNTKTGNLAQDISYVRPDSIILALTSDNKVYNELSLKWGVYSHIIDEVDNTDELVKIGKKVAKEELSLKKGDLIMVIGGIPITGHTNFIKIEEID